MKNNKTKLNRSRREFLGQMSASAVASKAMLGGLLGAANSSLGAAECAGADCDDYKAVVCVFLSGGADSYNMLVPYGDKEYADYKAARSNLALMKSMDDKHPDFLNYLAQDELAQSISYHNTILPLKATHTGSRQFAVHPGMAGIQSLFDAEKLSFVANIGTLVEPHQVPSNFANYAVSELPKQLFSHSDQMMHWQTSYPQGGMATGWAGRLADNMHGEWNANHQLPFNVSLAGTNMMQTGANAKMYAISEAGSVTMRGKASNSSAIDRKRYAYMQAMYSENKSHAFESAYLNAHKNSDDLNGLFQSSFDSTRVDSTAFPASALAADLQAVRRTIAAQSAAGNVKRQLFFVNVGGWDHHSQLVFKQDTLVDDLSRSLKAFYDSLEASGLVDNVLTYTASDFGRSMRSNGSGSDHGWGGNVMVMGGGVKGGQVFGEYPSSLALGQGQDVAEFGRVMPTTPTDLLYADVAEWLGAKATDLPSILPNYNNLMKAVSVGGVQKQLSRLGMFS